MNINYLINPNDYNSRESYAKLLFFNQLGEKFLEQDIFYSDNNHPSLKGGEIINNLIIQEIEKFN